MTKLIKLLFLSTQDIPESSIKSDTIVVNDAVNDYHSPLDCPWQGLYWWWIDDII